MNIKNFVFVAIAAITITTTTALVGCNSPPEPNFEESSEVLLVNLTEQVNKLTKEATKPVEPEPETSEPPLILDTLEDREEPYVAPPQPEVYEVEVEEPVNSNYLGTFTLTAYCGCNGCNGGWGNITATGTTPVSGRTIAVDPSVIPYGTEVTINGHTYVAEDCGGAIVGNRIDIYHASHSEALNFGRQTAEVYIN